MLGTIAIAILVMAFLGVIPTWAHSHKWGYAPTKGVGAVLLVVVVIVLISRI